MPLADPEKRRQIMARSMALGHCICSPDRPCPCDIFTDKGLCPCAGDRPDPVDISTLKLTALVHNAGCASKIAPADLEEFLGRLPHIDNPAVISGLPAGDDAGVYRLSDDQALVQTVDVFTPCVDDPYLFGKICAANCLSDVYAMGAVPKTALSILAFPSETLHGEAMYLMMKGAMEALEAAGCSLLGGHSIKDDEIKLGFAITGFTEPSQAVAFDTIKQGDMMVLTKPLGTGVLSFAQQIGRPDTKGLTQAEASMMTLNKDASEAMMEIGVSACTDVTGFGLFGHLTRMVRKSGVCARIFADTLPAFNGALELLEQGVIPGAIERNMEFVADDLLVDDNVSLALKHLGFDAQTSGGLLIFVPKERHDKLLDVLQKKGVTPHTIGQVVQSPKGKIHLVASESQRVKTNAVTAAKTLSELNENQNEPSIDTQSTNPPPSAALAAQTHSNHDGCCADVFGDNTFDDDQVSTAADSMSAFGSLMQSVGKPGLLDERTKELINFALVLISRCDPCLNIHIEKALGMGITKEELDEVAWCAVSMGGAPIKMFYQSFWEEAGRERKRQ